MADRVVVMNAGRVEQEGAAGGSLRASRHIVRRQLRRLAADQSVRWASLTAAVEVHRRASRSRDRRSGPVVLGIRPESVARERNAERPRESPRPSPWAARCSTRPTVRFGLIRFLEAGAEPRHREGDHVCPSVSLPRRALLFDKASGRRIDVRSRLDPALIDPHARFARLPLMVRQSPWFCGPDATDMSHPDQSKVLTAIVGSYPKPRYVYRQNGRSLLDSFGFAFDRRRQEVGSSRVCETARQGGASRPSRTRTARASTSSPTAKNVAATMCCISSTNWVALTPVNRKLISMRGWNRPARRPARHRQIRA